MGFFRQFPKTAFDFEGNGINTKILDIFRFVKADDAFLDDSSIYTYYDVQNGDRPDVVSQLLYKTPDYYWTFFVINEQLKTGLTAWPMTPVEFDAFIEQEYSGNVVIQTHPQIEYTYELEGIPGEIKNYINTIAGRFDVGEVIKGAQTDASGTIIAINNSLNQLVVKMDSGSPDFSSSESLLGQGILDENNPSQYRVSPYQIVPTVIVYPGEPSGTTYQPWQQKGFTIYSHRDAPHHYEDSTGTIVYPASTIDETKILSNGVLIDNPDYQNSDTGLTIVTNYEYELQLNDERSKIRVLRAESVFSFAQRFKELINA